MHARLTSCACFCFLLFLILMVVWLALGAGGAGGAAPSAGVPAGGSVTSGLLVAMPGAVTCV